MPSRDLMIDTADGRCPATLFLPDTRPEDPETGVILYMDAFGPRPALVEMAERIANAGHLVLLPDLFYRHGEYGPFDVKTAFSHEETAKQIKGMMGDTTQAMTQSDSRAFIDVLAKEGAQSIGTVGYCMGGGRAINAAAAYPDEIKAAASFHGGGLASDAEDSPHRKADKLKARIYVGSAGVDNSFPPEQSARLEQAFRSAEVDYAIENYVGMKHGWTVPDLSVYDAVGAERHWRRLLTLFSETLGSGSSAQQQPIA